MKSMIATHRLRVVDLLLIALSAPIWVPALAIIGVAVLLTSGRPVFFCQERVGRDGQTFSMRKFRSMRNGNNPLIPDPERITPVGSFLRRTSLDELPQLLNVIDGSMSLVGPRPMLPAQLPALSEDQAARHAVLPGLTGLAQVNGRNSLSWDERVVYDTAWAAAPSLRTYVSVLRRTGKTVLSGAGVSGHDAADRVLTALDRTVLDLDEIELTTVPPADSPAHADVVNRP